MDAIVFVLLWTTASAATYLYLFQYEVQVTPTSLVAFAAWATLAFRGTSIEWVSSGEPVPVSVPTVVTAFCVFLALMSGFVVVADYQGAYPPQEMVGDSSNGDLE